MQKGALAPFFRNEVNTLRLLISGFEPFGDDSLNPSWEAVALLPDMISGIELTKIKLPVAFGRAKDLLLEKAESIKPDFIIAVGLAAGRPSLSFEFVGINWQDARIADNRGYKPLGKRIEDAAPDAYFTTLPVHAMASALKEKNIPATLSYSAGTFVCNDVLFSLLHAANTKAQPYKAGFIHVPAIPEMKKGDENFPTMSLDAIVEGLSFAISTLAQDTSIPPASFGHIS